MDNNVSGIQAYADGELDMDEDSSFKLHLLSQSEALAFGVLKLPSQLYECHSWPL